MPALTNQIVFSRGPPNYDVISTLSAHPFHIFIHRLFLGKRGTSTVNGHLRFSFPFPWKSEAQPSVRNCVVVISVRVALRPLNEAPPSFAVSAGEFPLRNPGQKNSRPNHTGGFFKQKRNGFSLFRRVLFSF